MDNQSQPTQIQPIVHCGNLSSKTTQSDLQSLFSRVCPVVKVSLKKRADGSTPFAFVYFLTLQDAENIIKEFNYYELHGKQINLMLYNADKDLPEGANIFVKNLPPNLNSKDLCDIFKMFGQIISCKVASNDKGELKGFGYVQYSNPKSAKKAIASCKNVKIGSYALQVDLYNPKVKTAKETIDPIQVTFTNCYVKNFPCSMTEEKLLKILQEFGNVNSLYFPTSSEGKSVGYAFANFSAPEEALKAISNLHGKQLFTAEEMGKDEGLTPEPFYIQKAENKKERAELLKKQHEKSMHEGQMAKCNLYVSNIPDTFTTDEIKNIFLKFGKITNLKISKSPTTSKQYGYVCYSTPEEACIAYEKLDGTSLDDQKLQILYYKTKQERTSESEKNLTDSLVMLKSLSIQDDKHSGQNKKTYHAIQDAVFPIAHLFKADWKVFEATTAAEFSKEVAKVISKLPSELIKEILNSSELLGERIRRTIDDIKTKPASGF